MLKKKVLGKDFFFGQKKDNPKDIEIIKCELPEGILKFHEFFNYEKDQFGDIIALPERIFYLLNYYNKGYKHSGSILDTEERTLPNVIEEKAFIPMINTIVKKFERIYNSFY